MRGPAVASMTIESVSDSFAVSVFSAPITNTTRFKTVGWQELCRMLKEDVVVLPDNNATTKAKHGQYFVRGQITGTRADENLADCCLLILDIDKPLDGKPMPTVYEIHDTMKDILHIVCTTATPGRSRIIVPVEPYAKERTATLTRQLYDSCIESGLEFAYAGESNTKSQPWFYGQTLDRNNHVCIVNDDGLLFSPDPDYIYVDDHTVDGGTARTTHTELNSSGNHLADFIAQLKSGTIHQAAKTYAGWLFRTSNQTKRQTFNDLTALIDELCTDPDKVQRWHDGERAELERWFLANVEGVEPEPELLTAEECQTESNFSLEIPAAVADPGGLISLGMEALSQPGMAAIPQYSLAVVMTTIANAMAGRIVFRKIHPNLYNVKIGPTSTGKTEGDKAMVPAIRNTGLVGFYGPSDLASGPALLRALVATPRCLIVVDEGTSLFRRSGKADTLADGKRDALLELFSASGQVIEKAYSDKKNNICINNPCLSLTANATPELFQSIEDSDFTTGIMQRFDFWCYDGPSPKRGRPVDSENKALTEFAAGILAIFESNPSGGNLSQAFGVSYSLSITKTGDDRLQEWSDTVIERVNSVDDDGLRGIISRAYDLAIKYAMVHHAATRPASELAEPLTIEDIEYGIATAWMLADWKINRLRNRITCGDFHRDCELFKEAIRRALANKRRPVWSVLANRCRPLKNFPGTYLDQITRSLVSRGEIVLDTTKGKPTAYNLVRQ